MIGCWNMHPSHCFVGLSAKEYNKSFLPPKLLLNLIVCSYNNSMLSPCKIALCLDTKINEIMLGQIMNQPYLDSRPLQMIFSSRFILIMLEYINP